MEKKITLSEAELPQRWYNIISDLPEKPAPPVHPIELRPVKPDDLKPLFPMALIEQEMSDKRYIEIPVDVLDIYRIWRPTPLIRAKKLEEAIETKCKIYYKNEGVSPPGSHKPNTAVAQAYYNYKEGIETVTTETGAGQWGSALSFACNFFGLNCKVFMVKVSYQQKPYRKSMMKVWGAEVHSSPSEETEIGRRILSESPDNPGSLGIAISEAIEVAVKDEKAHYSLGSVLNHVLLHQTIIGEEAIKQMEIAGDYPDVVIGCVGGGSNFAGIVFPFIREKLKGKEIEAIAVEPTSCPTLTKGEYLYDFGDIGKMTPLLLMHTLGHNFIPPKIHAGGLRYHGMAPLLSHLVKNGLIKARAYPQLEVFEAAVTFAKSEGIIPAPETSHAIRCVVDVAKEADREGKPKTILFNFSGHGHFDMTAYEQYFEGNLEDYFFDMRDAKKNIEELREINRNISMS